MSAKLSLISALLLTTLLAACGPNTQMGSSTSLDGDQNTQIAGVVVAQDATTPSAGQVAAAKARVPYQYREKYENDLRDFAVNLDPNTNRSLPAD